MLTLAIPSKGRLKEKTELFFKQAGIPVATNGGEREYAGFLENVGDVRVIFLQAAEIARQLIAGAVDLGVTGTDLLGEYGAFPDDETDTRNEPILLKDGCVHIFKKLDFGKADLVISVPETWIDVHTMEDLDDITWFFRKKHGRRFRIATKYLHLTNIFLRKNGFTDYRIIESQGATEGAPGSGAAEAVADITETGSTLRANHLKIISDGLILRSQALLVASYRARWTDEKFSALRRVIDFISAETAAANITEMCGSFAPGCKSEILNCMIQFKAEEILFSDSGFLCLIEQNKASRFSEMLRASGAKIVTARACRAVFRADNPMYDGFLEALNRKSKTA